MDYTEGNFDELMGVFSSHTSELNIYGAAGLISPEVYSNPRFAETATRATNRAIQFIWDCTMKGPVPSDSVQIPIEIALLRNEGYENDPEKALFMINEACSCNHPPDVMAALFVEKGIALRLLKNKGYDLSRVCFDAAVKFARDHNYPNILCEALAHRVDLNLCEYRESEVSYNKAVKNNGDPLYLDGEYDIRFPTRYRTIMSASYERVVADALEAYALAQQLNRGDMLWFSKKLAKAIHAGNDLGMFGRFSELATEKPVFDAVKEFVQSRIDSFRSRLS